MSLAESARNLVSREDFWTASWTRSGPSCRRRKPGPSFSTGSPTRLREPRPGRSGGATRSTRLSSAGSGCEPGPFRGRPRSADLDAGVDFAYAEELARDGLDLAAPLALRDGGVCGWLVLGRKRVGRASLPGRIWPSCASLTAEMTPNLERIRLQEEVIYERASREKLDELNALKTEFISSVSHELRTPMTSIQGLAEMLQSGRVIDPAHRDKYLGLLATESGRLSRLIHNVLDYGRIEQKAKTLRAAAGRGPGGGGRRGGGLRPGPGGRRRRHPDRGARRPRSSCGPIPIP